MLPITKRTISSTGTSRVVPLPMDWVRSKQSKKVTLIYGRAILMISEDDTEKLPEIMKEMVAVLQELEANQQLTNQENVSLAPESTTQ